MLPIFKRDEKCAVSNYKPIALMCNFTNIPECVLSNIVYSHVITSIVPEHYGFIKGRSATTNLGAFTQFISSAWYNRMQVGATYTNFSKTFDSLLTN